MHCLALRPEPGLSATLDKARALGLAITGLALSEIRAVPWDCPDPARFDGLLIGSANALLQGRANLARIPASGSVLSSASQSCRVRGA
jgi:uroporphyrinogen-III synthase